MSLFKRKSRPSRSTWGIRDQGRPGGGSAKSPQVPQDRLDDLPSSESGAPRVFRKTRWSLRFREILKDFKLTKEKTVYLTIPGQAAIARTLRSTRFRERGPDGLIRPRLEPLIPSASTSIFGFQVLEKTRLPGWVPATAGEAASRAGQRGRGSSLPRSRTSASTNTSEVLKEVNLEPEFIELTPPALNPPLTSSPWRRIALRSPMSGEHRATSPSSKRGASFHAPGRRGQALTQALSQRLGLDNVAEAKKRNEARVVARAAPPSGPGGARGAPRRPGPRRTGRVSLSRVRFGAPPGPPGVSRAALRVRSGPPAHRPVLRASPPRAGPRVRPAYFRRTARSSGRSRGRPPRPPGPPGAPPGPPGVSPRAAPASAGPPPRREHLRPAFRCAGNHASSLPTYRGQEEPSNRIRPRSCSPSGSL